MEQIRKSQSRYDALVIGARCAGAATALLLARAGARVLLVDQQAYGSDTMSTHVLMRGAVIQLNRWGVLAQVEQAGTPTVRSTTFHYGPEAIRIPIKPDFGVDGLYAPRRTLLDRLLVDAALRAGAEARHGVLLDELQLAADGRVEGAFLRAIGGPRFPVRADIVIGADGRHSTLARLVGAGTKVEGSSASGIVYGYFAGLSQDGFNWHFADKAAAGVIPTNDGHCVFAAVPSSQFVPTFREDVAQGFRRVLSLCSPELGAEIGAAQPLSRLLGFAGAVGYLRQCQGPGWALVGDAGYFKDPLTAHGITDALRDAELLSRAIVEGGSTAHESYERQRDALSLPFLQLTSAIASFSWNLDQVKELHTQMSSIMKDEVSHLVGLSQMPPLAA